MTRVRTSWILAGIALSLVLVAGCGSGGEDETAARQAELDALTELRQELDAKRQELADLKASVEEAMAAEESEATEEGAPTVEELETQANQLEAQVLELGDSFLDQLVAFINSDPPLVGEPLSETQLQAIRMKSDEDMLVAQGYIEEGGDYRRAIRIYSDALAADPDNEKLQAALAAAEEMRFMTPERFAAAQKRMTPEEVRATLGQVNHRNVKKYEDRGVTAWFYPTAEDGSAAGVFFRERGGRLEVYELEFEAVKPKTEQQEG